MPKNHIDRLLSRVPRLGRSWRYIPLRGLPEGTELIVTTSDAKPPPDPPLVNGVPETDVQRLPAGEYQLTIGIWPTITLQSESHPPLGVKSILDNIAPTSIFTANYDFADVTHRITTGPIQTVRIIGTPYFLTDKDAEKPRPRRRNPLPRNLRLGAK